MITQIEHIVCEKDNIFIYTDMFKIDIQKAFDTQECKIPTNETLKYSNLKKRGDRIFDIIENYEFGYVTNNEVVSQIWDCFYAWKGLLFNKSWKQKK
jgi:hypothetical protein